MDNRYKIIISNKNLYKEIDLEAEAQELKIGTGVNCDIRLRKDLFFGHIELSFVKKNSEWVIFCSENLYISLGDIRKLLTKQLTHGDKLIIKYQESDIELFELSFMIDFEYVKKDYNRKIFLGTKNQIKIGGTSDCDIRIRDKYIGNDYFLLKASGNEVKVEDQKTKYGIYVNGRKVIAQKIKNCDFISVVGFSFYYKEGILFSTSDDTVQVNGLQYQLLEEYSTHFQYPKFNRNTRIQYVIPNDELEIQQPMQKPQKPKKNLVMSLIPSLVMLAMTIVLRGIMGGGGTFVIYSAISMSLGIVMSVVTFVRENKEYQKEFDERIQKYNEYIHEKKCLIEDSRKNELRIRRLIYESLENSIKEVEQFGKRLFERTQGETDFLQVYLGEGKIESSNQVKYTKQEFVDLEDPLAKIPEEVAESYRYIENAPIVADFNTSCGVGVVGNRENLYQALKNITLDLTIRHFYGEVRFVYILDKNDAEKINWVRWLRNVENPQLDVRNIVCDEESKNVLLENLYRILSVREIEAAQSKEKIFEEQYVIFVTDNSAISCHPVSKYIKNCTKYGFTFVFFEEYEENLPQGCTEIIRLAEQNSGSTLKSENGDIVATYKSPVISEEVAKEIAIKLAAVTVDEVSLEGELTKNITMFELLGIISVDDLDLKERWNSSQVYKSLSAPLGVKSKNQVVSLDISDKSGGHGPHGLVAGTTGSGKSEILQTYILSIATLFHPYEVGFVIIDFKGGGMANQFKDLPHLIGTITNIDGREINRSLLSIKAELVKRQEMFSEAGVNHINDYIKLYKANKVDVPMPHLIMIVDEFAELKAEHPDFMKELISAARIGRTLGVHLILATQKPAGVVDAQIWSNSKFKLCLKVQTKEDSNEVIKTPLAAEIVEPGRAYFQVGNNEIFELFQSAYSGANVPAGNDNNEKIYAIYERNLWGKKTLKYTNKKKTTEANADTQLQAIVKYVDSFCKENSIEKLPGICLPSLNDIIRTDELNYDESTSEAVSVPIGFFDDPEQQRQGEVLLELSKENVYIVGSSQMGKTVMLQTILYGLIRKYSSAQVNLYLVDCGSMVLKIFEDSAHVGGVVLSNEEEKCRNLFKLLNTFVIQRKQILSGKGVGNYAAYLEAGYTDMPMIVVAIDNMAAFKEYFPNQAEEINTLTREAQGVGISFIITAATSNALNYRTQANFAKKLVLNCNDTNEYSSMFGHCKMTPKENAGRGLCVIDKRILEYQTAIFGKSKKEAERSEELKSFIASRNNECKQNAIQIPMIPNKLLLSKAMQDNPKIFRNRGILPIGMDFATVDFRAINLNQSGSLALMGNAESRERFVVNFMKMISQTVVFHAIEAIIIDDKAKTLKECAGYGFVKHYTYDSAEALSLVSDYCDTIMDRCDDDEEKDTYLMLIINSADVLKKLNADKRESKNLADAIKNAQEASAFILFANIENQAVGFNSSDVLKTIKEGRQGILFAPLAESKMFDVSGRVKAEVSFDSSMGYHFSGSSYTKIKIFD